MSWSSAPTLVVQLAGADATILAASAAVKRRIRHVRVVNTTGGAVTFSMAVGAAFAANIAMYNARSIAANGEYSEFFSPGQQFTNLAVRMFASAATSLTAHVSYDEEPTT